MDFSASLCKCVQKCKKRTQNPPRATSWGFAPLPGTSASDQTPESRPENRCDARRAASGIEGSPCPAANREHLSAQRGLVAEVSAAAVSYADQQRPAFRFSCIGSPIVMFGPSMQRWPTASCRCHALRLVLHLRDRLVVVAVADVDLPDVYRARRQAAH